MFDDEPNPEKDNRPTLDDLLHDIATSFMPMRQRFTVLQQLKTATPRDAANYLLKMLTLDRPIPGPVRIKRNGKEFWSWPERTHYHILARQFLAQPVDSQSFIAAAAEDCIQWRGDSEMMFRSIVAETERMREMDVKAYKQQARDKFKQLRGGMTA